jgi:outer membrane protein OmpA-like peptidoglycan-associated protein
MPGGFGGMDIYESDFENGEWSSPKNLGAEINSEGDEVFPNFTENNLLYYSSNGKAGFGGLDIFYSQPLTNGKWQKPVNMGYPMNSSKDDFGICTKNNLQSGYLTSNRNGSDDIFMFNAVCYFLNGIVVDAKTNEPIEDAVVKIYENGKWLKDGYTGSDGKFKCCFEKEMLYEFSVDKLHYETAKIKLPKIYDVAKPVIIPLQKNELIPTENFDSTKIKISIAGVVYNEGNKQPMDNVLVVLENYRTNKHDTLITKLDGKFHFNLAYNTKFKLSGNKQNCGSNWYEISTTGIKNSQELNQGMGMYCMGDVIKLENIYYDLDKYFIRPDAALELDKTVAVLKKYLTMRIELRSHTDSRAKFNYNLTLSQKRAESAVQYLISKGINAERILPMGYGETQLTNKCADDIPCSEIEHQANRRTEFKIISF